MSVGNDKPFCQNRTSEEIMIVDGNGNDANSTKREYPVEDFGKGKKCVTAFLNIWKHVTIEPVMLLHTVVFYGTQPIMESLYVDKSCLVTLQKTSDVCANLPDHEDDQLEVQKYSSKLQGTATVAQNAIPVIILLYLGPLSDRFGRKIFLVGNLVMMVLSQLMFLLCSVFMQWPAELTLVGPILYSLGASMGGTQMMLFACIGDITTSVNRTFRLGILKIFMGYGKPLGRLVGGQVFAAGGYAATFGTAVILLLLCLFYVAFMSETLSPEAKNKSTISATGVGVLFEIPKSVAAAVYKKKGSQRNIVLIIFFIHSALYFALNPPFYLFSRFIFDWDATDYSYWLLLRDFAAANALMLLVPLLIGRLKLSDGAVGMTAAGSAVFMYVVLGQIRSDSMMWLMILAPLLGMWQPASYLINRAIVSKIASGPQELGKLLAILAMIEEASLAAAGPMYAALYNATIDILPGTSFLLAAAILTIAVFGFRICDIFIQRERGTASV